MRSKQIVCSKLVWLHLAATLQCVVSSYRTFPLVAPVRLLVQHDDSFARVTRVSLCRFALSPRFELDDRNDENVD